MSLAVVVESKRSGGRLVVRLDRDRLPGSRARAPGLELPPAGGDSYYVFELVGLTAVEEGGRILAGCEDVTPGVANDVLELDGGIALPMVEECVRAVDLRGPNPDCARIRARKLISQPMQIDVFTLLPHAFAWLTEQRPVAAVLGSGLDLRFLNYRDYTPLTGGQVDDEPYGGGAGMVLRVDIVWRALEAVYGETGRPARDRLLAPGPRARPGARRRARRGGRS